MSSDADSESRIRNIDDDYVSLCRKILCKGHVRTDRTGVGVSGLFGERLDIDLKLGFPLLTTKRVFWMGVVRELLWFISGSTNAKQLADKGVHIWDGNTSRTYLDSRGLKDYPVGEVGPSYGWQWRYFGSTYRCSDSSEAGGCQHLGKDQLADVISQIRTNPTDRRLIVSAWNPNDLPKMALPPCHLLYQFYVDNGELSCQVYQRSVDVGLGLPFNIASYALLTHLVAHVTGLQVGRLIMCLGDTHIYNTHRKALQDQIFREPRELPTLKLKRATEDIDSITEDDIQLVGYRPHPPLSEPLPMAV